MNIKSGTGNLIVAILIALVMIVVFSVGINIIALVPMLLLALESVENPIAFYGL